MRSTRESSGRGVLRAGTAPTRVGRVFIIVLAAALLQVVTQTVFARGLSRSDVGLLSLIMGAFPLLATLAIMGQDSAIVRFFTRPESSEHDARAHARRTLSLSLPIGAVASVAGALIYGLTGAAAVTLAVLVLSQNTITVVTSFLRARHRYELAMAATRIPVIAAALALVGLYAADALTLNRAFAVLIAAFWISAGVLAARALAPGGFLERGGSRPVPRSVLKEGLLFFGLSVSFSAMIAMDKLVIAKMMDLSDLAVYATIFTIMKGFDFIFYSVSYVLMPRVNDVARVRLSRLNWQMAVVALAVALGYLLFGRWGVHALYEGRYDAGVYLIVPFALSGVMKLFYSIPSSIIGGRLPSSALRQFLWFNLAGMAVNVALDIALIRSMGLMGAAVATAIAWALRLVGGYAIVAVNRAHLSGPIGGKESPGASAQRL